MNDTDMSSEKRISPPTWTVSVPICSDQSWGPKTTHDLKRFPDIPYPISCNLGKTSLRDSILA